jgi:hypothetical protein
MRINDQIARQLRAVHCGGNWTAVNLKETLINIGWQQAITKFDSFNTIAALVYHMNYYVCALINVLQGYNLDAHDKFSFDHPLIRNTEDWHTLLEKTWSDAEQLAVLIEHLPESKWGEDFPDPEYGNYFRNIEGVVEHIHYHLGQIVLIKKLYLSRTNPNE